MVRSAYPGDEGVEEALDEHPAVRTLWERSSGAEIWARRSVT
ncbi:MAG: hypothetical protein M0Z41_18390 [Peptococcaceae bacterium]|nr:hypothetical protein [Peptococcaceae bacterium]